MENTEQIKQVRQFRYISIAEAISFIILLGVAMPLKYLFDQPAAVKIFGWVHGVLFVAYFFQLLYLTVQLKWKFQRLFFYFIAALLPLLPFLVERNLRREYS